MEQRKSRNTFSIERMREREREREREWGRVSKRVIIILTITLDKNRAGRENNIMKFKGIIENRKLASYQRKQKDRNIETISLQNRWYIDGL